MVLNEKCMCWCFINYLIMCCLKMFSYILQVFVWNVWCCSVSNFYHACDISIIYCSGGGLCLCVWVAEWQLMCIVELISTGDGPNNGNTRECRNKAVCVGCTERAIVVSFIIILFVLCNASVSALQIVFSKSLYAILTLRLPWLRFFRAFSLLGAWVPESLSTKVVNCVVLFIVCV